MLVSWLDDIFDLIEDFSGKTLTTEERILMIVLFGILSAIFILVFPKILLVFALVALFGYLSFQYYNSK